MQPSLKPQAQLKWWWLLLAFFALTGIIFTSLSAFIPNLHTFQRGFKIYLHFTFQANLMGLISALMVIANKASLGLQRFKVLTTAALTITGLVFWALIFPTRGIGEYRPFSFVGTIMVHALTPVLIVVAFLNDTLKQTNHFYLSPLKTILMLVVYPLLWLVMAIIIYYTIDYSIYSFLNFKANPVWKTLAYIVGITLLFVGFIYLYLFLNNRYARKL